MPLLSKQCLTLCYLCIMLLQESAESLTAALVNTKWSSRYTARARWIADRLYHLAE